MYKLYKGQKIGGIFLYAFSLFLVLFVILSLVETFNEEGISVLGIFGGLFFFVLAFVFFKLAGAMSKPYSHINSLKKTNPQLVKEYEMEFMASENIQNIIWLGQKYIFLRGVRFEVALYEEIKNIRIHKHHSKYGSSYELSFSIKDKIIDVNFSVFGDNKTEVVAIAERIAALSNCKVENDL